MPLSAQSKIEKAVKTLQKSYDSEAFRYLYDQLSGKLYYVCLRYLKDETDAKDVLQEVFIIIHEKIKTFKNEGSFDGWAKRIAVRHCIYYLKKKDIHIELNEVKVPVDEQTDFDSDIEEQHTQKKLKWALQQLPDGYRTIINLYILENYSHAEIAKMLSINESTSRSQLNRAKAALRKLISVRK